MSSACLSAASATAHSSGEPTYFSGRVDSSASNSVRPKSRSSPTTNFSSDASSSCSCPGAQKMCESSWVKPRARVRPCTTPDFSYRYTVPNSNSRSGSSR